MFWAPPDRDGAGGMKGQVPAREGAIRIAHVITGLETGGAQRSLLSLIQAMDPAKFQSIVVSLKPLDSMSQKFSEAGIEIHHLGIRKDPVSLLLGLARLCRIMEAYRPHIMQGWMYHANVLCTLAQVLLPGKPKVVWGIRHSLHDLTKEKRTTRWVIKLGARLSRKADRIVYNAHSSAAHHRALGYNEDRELVIPNGVDCEQFKPSEEARKWLRREVLGLEDNQFLVGMVARFHPMKGHDTFLKAAGMLARQRKDVKFVLVGKGMDGSNQVLWSVIEANKVESLVFLLGETQHIESILPGLDCLCCSSHWGESFPNAVAEAMACGVPCVVTDVGDSARIVGDCGLVVPKGNPEAIAAALVKLLDLDPREREGLGRKARERSKSFSLDGTKEMFAMLYESLVEAGRHALDSGSGSQQERPNEVPDASLPWLE
jgi:glycosyltransferase involved in cell wall biosynthesis